MSTEMVTGRNAAMTKTIDRGEFTRAMLPTAAEFMQTARAASGGNTPFAIQYGQVLREVVEQAASRAPRTVQQTLGPSELGTPCHRQVAGKFARLGATNHVTSPWPSIVGTALHSWFAEAFTKANEFLPVPRWLAEQRVWPCANHPGTADLYDGDLGLVVDHKCLGPTSTKKIKRGAGPPIYYKKQVKLYAKGYLNMGFPVRGVLIVVWPRTEATLDNLYCWYEEWVPERDEREVSELLELTLVRRAFGEAIRDGLITLLDVPAEPSDEDCYFCPFYRPDSARVPHPFGCPGTIGQNS